MEKYGLFVKFIIEKLLKAIYRNADKFNSQNIANTIKGLLNFKGTKSMSYKLKAPYRYKFEKIKYQISN